MSASVAWSTHAFAADSSSSAGTTSSISPAVFAFFGSFSLPSSRNGAAAITPIFRTSRVVPPMPGKMPTMISGSPIFAFGLSAAKIRWHASGISRPIPSAVPGSAAATGLPPLLVFGSIPARSSLRRTPCIRISPSIRPLAGSSPASSFIFAMMFRSIPPAKSALADVITMPFTASSASAAATQASSSAMPSMFSTFIDLSGRSQVMVATPSASVSLVKMLIFRLRPSEHRGCRHGG